MSDRLDAITAALGEWDAWSRSTNPDDAMPNHVALDDVRWLVAEVRRLRQRHAEAVEAASRKPMAKDRGHQPTPHGWRPWRKRG